MDFETIKEGFLKAYIRTGHSSSEHGEVSGEKISEHSEKLESIGTGTIEIGTGVKIESLSGTKIESGSGVKTETGTGTKTETGSHEMITTSTVELNNHSESGPSSVIMGISLEFIIIFILILIYNIFPKSKFVTIFDLVFENVYDFFDDLFGKEEKKGIKIFITTLFFVIFISNFLGLFLEFLLPIFGEKLEHLIKIPTADINFNIGMAIIAVIIVLYEQSKHLGFGHFVYEYFPVFGKNYIPFERGNLPTHLYIPIFIIVKIFDIIISVFLGLLEIVGFLAKIISLSFRLFGNITSGSILLVMVVGSISGMTSMISPNFEFPVVIPLLVYMQEAMVALIQAFVFPLLIAIFIKVAKIH